jgi:shikimate dehydrogenase
VLCSAAGRLGVPVVGGLEVLVRQGAHAFRLWTGREAPLDVMRAALAGP